jgi:tripartite-type tricarboxylate transporter receptor subunit TctC
MRARTILFAATRSSLRGRAVLVAAILAALLPVAASGAYPDKPIRWIVPFPPGGATDVVARIIGPALAQRLGQPLVIENRPGAGGNVGSELVAKGPADGSLILLAIPGLVTNPYFLRGSIDPQALRPVIQLTRVSFVLLASPRLAARNVTELVDAIRTNPGGVSCGSSGALPTVGCALLGAHAGADLLLVQYKGNAPALAALMSGEISLLFDVSNTAMPQVKAGRVRALAATGRESADATLEGIPTLAQTFPGFDLEGWQGVVVARDTPAPVVQRLNAEIAAVLAAPDVRQRLTDSGLAVAGGSPEAFGEVIQRDAIRFGKALTAAGVRPE